MILRQIQSVLQTTKKLPITFQFCGLPACLASESMAVITYQKLAWGSHVLIDPSDWLSRPSGFYGPGDRKNRYSPTRRNDWSSSKNPFLPPPKQNTPAVEKPAIMISFKRLVTAPASQQHSNERRQIQKTTRPLYQVCVCCCITHEI